MTPEQIARVCHEANRAYCATIGDNSQPLWDSAPEWQKSSAIAGVEHHLAHPDTTPADSHAGWLAIKVNEGWVYGEVKDPDAKTHPCCVPYEDLPADQQLKDALFSAVIRALGGGQ